MLKNITKDKEIDDRQISEEASDSDGGGHDEYEFVNKCLIDFSETYILK